MATHVAVLKPKVAAKVRASLGDRAAPDADWTPKATAAA
jgi:hypothetical protein